MGLRIYRKFYILLIFIGGLILVIFPDILDNGTPNESKSLFGLFLITISIVAFLIVLRVDKNEIKEEERLQSETEKIKSDYFNALMGNDKGKALRFGRIYYGSLRDDGNVTIYDEQAINNDLNSMKDTTEFIQPQADGSSLDKLEKLAKLKAQGVLTEDEFKVEKAKILSEK